MIIKPTPKRTKERDEKQTAHAATFDRLKTVVRRLPPNLPEDIFWSSVQQWVTEDTVSWKVYYAGKVRVKANKESVPSRAYIAFKNEQLLAQFSKDYDGHLFRDKAGNESHAVVEFAPYQKVPGEKKKQDARTGTIEKDEDYISFIASLQQAKDAEPPSMEALLASTQPTPQPKTTPLLEALKAERAAAKDRETILRSHAHYRDQGRKEDAKGKTAAKPPPASKHTPKKGNANQAAAPQARQKEITILPKQPANANPPKQPKAGKNSRPAPSAGAATPSKAPQANSTAAAAASASTTTADTASGSTPAPAATPSRRGRPMIGLGRQFEAALNGAGVKARPTRAKDEESSKDGDAPKAANHTSPKRDRVIKQTPVAASSADPNTTKPPVGRGAGENGPARGGRGRGRGRGGYRGGS